MSPPLLVCRPEPGASATARAAEALGLTAVVAPLFRIERVVWDPPAPELFDALVMTSANAARHAGDALRLYKSLPAFAVGDATAAAMRAVGLNAEASEGDAETLIATIASGPHRRLLHLCGEHHHAPVHPDLSIRSVPVYCAVAVDALPAFMADALGAEAIIMLHSPRAAALFASLATKAGCEKSGLRLVAISPAAAAAAGRGWRSAEAAPAPTDAAMLAIARDLCDKASR